MCRASWRRPGAPRPPNAPGSVSARQLMISCRADHRLFERERKFGDEIAAHEIDRRDVAEAGVGAERHFQMRDFRAGEPRVGCRRRASCSTASASKPTLARRAAPWRSASRAAPRLRRRVRSPPPSSRGPAARRFPGARQPRVEPALLAHGDVEDFGAAETRRASRARKRGEPIGVDQVGLGDDDDVRLLELLAVDVEDLVGKASALRRGRRAARRAPDRRARSAARW